MTPDIRQRFQHLLYDITQWQSESERDPYFRSLLRGHKIWEHLNLSGSVSEAANRLLNLADIYGSGPFLILLAQLRDSQAANPARRQEIDLLSAALRGPAYQRPRVAWPHDPYRGLSYFDRPHAPIFFGRETELHDLIQTLVTTPQGRRFCVILGASGSGKSSLVRAGLWARLADGKVPELPGSERWLVSVMKTSEVGSPAASLHHGLVNALKEQDRFEFNQPLLAKLHQQPLAEIAEKILPPGDARWLLILDQMEELFSPEAAQDGALFIDRLLEATLASSRFQVVATLRSDFYHHCLNHPPLIRAISAPGGQFPLAAPSRLSLERMVTGPLLEVELPAPCALDPALPHVIAAGAEREKGGLALMAFALRDLYLRCLPKHAMTLADYQDADFGGLSGAIGRRADETLAALGAGGPAALRKVFARLVHVKQDDPPTRRRELISTFQSDPAAMELIEAFRRASLLVADSNPADQPVIEVAHEALLREWPTLARWIEQRREGFGLVDRVRTEATAWSQGDSRRRNHRPWSVDLIEEIRAKLGQAGLLEAAVQDDPAAAKLLTPEIDWILAEIKESATTHLRRHEIAIRLAEIGDPRPGVGVIDGIPDILWLHIPAGSVELEYEQDSHSVVEPFAMAAFPITIAQFRAFLDAPDGFHNRLWWTAYKPEPPASIWRTGSPNHPVTEVSWFDATVFCLWLSARLQSEVRLPDAPERQWAAQSAQPKFQYPWGPEWRDGHARTYESGITGATAVGMYPPGYSLQQVADLSGNVWDWCRNEYAEGRELRGGAWSHRSDVARAGDRSHRNPFGRVNNIGFRVVRASPIR